MKDTAGEEKYRAVASSYYRGAHGVILGMLLPIHTQYLCSNAPTAIQCTIFPRKSHLRPSLGGTKSLRLTFPNLPSRSSLATRLTWSVVHHLHSTPFLTPAQESSRKVQTSEGEAFALGMDSLFIETSAMTAVGVREIFMELAEKILDTPELWNGNPVSGSVNIDSSESESEPPCGC